MYLPVKMLINNLIFNYRRLRVDTDWSSQHPNVGTVRFQRPVAQGCRTRGHGQGWRSAVCGPRVSRGGPIAGENKPKSFDRIRVLGRPGAFDEPLWGQFNNYCCRQCDVIIIYYLGNYFQLKPTDVATWYTYGATIV